ncbi:hypothetical protein C3L33_10543, partial [Rhododendron williamsianum]
MLIVTINTVGTDVDDGGGKATATTDVNDGGEGDDEGVSGSGSGDGGRRADEGRRWKARTRPWCKLIDKTKSYLSKVGLSAISQKLTDGPMVTKQEAHPISLVLLGSHPAWIEDSYTVEQSSSAEESSSEDSVKANATLYIQMKFYPEMLQELLESYRKSKTFLDNETIWRYFRQIVEGVHHIHEKSFVHRDLTRSNIFLDDTKNIQIDDFGLATFLQDRSCGVAGNPLYIAPELQEEYDQVSDKADIFSLGLLLCDLIYQFGTDGERISVFARQGDFPKELAILGELLALSPLARPSAFEILQKDLPWRGRSLISWRALDASFWANEELTYF